MLAQYYHVVICQSVRLSHAGNLGSHNQCHTIAQGLWFSGAKDTGKIPTGTPKRSEVGRIKVAIFDQHLLISQKWCKIGTVTTEACALSNVDISSDLG